MLRRDITPPVLTLTTRIRAYAGVPCARFEGPPPEPVAPSPPAEECGSPTYDVSTPSATESVSTCGCGVILVADRKRKPFCPFARPDDGPRCQGSSCAAAVEHIRGREAVWTCGLVHTATGNQIIVARGDGLYQTFDPRDGQQCRA